MPDSAPPAPSRVSSRIPLSAQSQPPGARIEALVGGAARPATPPIEELLLLLHREIGRSRDPQQAAELKVRAALLTWDGRGESAAALRLIAGVDHPVATALRLQAAIDAPESAPLLAYADEVQRRGDLEEVAEVGELLLWRGEPARAAALLERSGERNRQVRALALSLAGRFAEAVEVLSTSGEPQALLLAAHLLEDRLGDTERARTLLRRVIDKAAAKGAPNSGILGRSDGRIDGAIGEQARALERLYDLESRRPPEAGRADVLRRKLDLLGGIPAVERAAQSAEPGEGPLQVELLSTAMLLGQSLERQGTQAAQGEAVTLLSAVERFCQKHREAAAEIVHGLVLRARARIEAARGNPLGAAAAWEELGRRAALLAAGRLPALSFVDGDANDSKTEGPAATDAATAGATGAHATGPHATGVPGASAALPTSETVSAPWAFARAYTRRAAELLDARSTAPADPARPGAPSRATPPPIPSRATPGTTTPPAPSPSRATTGTAAPPAARARALYEELFFADPSDGVLTLILARVLLSQGAATAAATALDHHARALPADRPAEQLRAARAAEALRDPRLVQHWLDIISGDRTAMEALLRLYRRRGDRPRLAAAYRRIAQLAAPSREPIEAQRGATYLAAAAALSLEALPAREAEAILGEAERDIEGPFGLLLLLCRTLLLRRLGRHAEYGASLLLLLRRVSDPETQADLHQQLARVAAEHLGDAELAQKSYRRVLELRPGDVVALHALAQLAQRSAGSAASPSGDGQPVQSVLLLRQAIDSALRGVAGGGDKDGPQAAALLLCELGALYQRPGPTGPARDEEQAIAAYREALRHDPRCRTAARALAMLHKESGRVPDWLDALEQALPLSRDDAERLPMLLELGQGAESQAGIASAQPSAAPFIDGPSAAERAAPSDAPPGAPAAAAAERAVRAYAGVLLIDPGHPMALASLERLCRQLDRWPLLVSILDPLPHNARSLRLLAEASERLGHWDDMARYREEELAQLQEPREVLRAARGLAELYENRLQQPEAAARVWERCYDAEAGQSATAATVVGMAAAPAALERLYTAMARFGDLARLLSREIVRVESALLGDLGADEVRELSARRHDLLLRLGAVQRDHLADLADLPGRDGLSLAAVTYETLLADWPDDPEALAALAALYSQQERPDELRRVLDQRARATEDPLERARVLLQAGELCEKRDELDKAQEAFAEAFALDPSSRTAFTSLERICYRREQWDTVMKMYDSALLLVEQHKSRAYRLGDLYSRRGQVLLQYQQKPREAAVDYLKALEFDPDNDAIQSALERIHAATGEWAPLIAAYERRAELQKDDGKRVEILRRAARVAAAKLRDVPEAIRLYQKLYAVDPTDTEALDALERHYDRSRDYEKLLSLLCTRLALATTEQESIALNLRIALLCEEGLRDHERAIEAYRQVLELQPSHREGLDAMARLFEANERWAELIEVTRRQIRLITDRTQKALLYFKCGSVMEAKFAKEDDAIRYYEAAVKTSPSCLPAVHGLRDIYLRRKDWPRVTQTLELEAKLWTEDKERAGIYAHIGQIYLDQLGDMDRAIQYYESALRVDKECLPANRALFEVYYARGDWARAVPMGQVLSAKVNREGEPRERSEFYRKRAVVAEHASDLRTAAESLVVALEIQPEHMEALELLVRLCRRDPSIYDFATTFRELEKLYRRREARQGLALVLVSRATLAERAYDVELAEELLSEAVKLSPGDYAVIEACVTTNERLRRFDLAKGALLAFIAHKGPRGPGERTAASEADRARARLRLAELHSEVAMEPEAAVAVLRELLSAAVPGDGSAEGDVPQPPQDLLRVARFRLIQELYLLGRYTEAHGEMDALIEVAVNPPDAGVATGLSAASSAAPPEELARYYDYLGRIQEAQGDGPAAQRNYRRAVDLDPAYALPVLALARRAAAAGDRPHAEALIRDALAQAAQRGDPTEELHLRRGVARLLAAVDTTQAVAAYREAIRFATSQLDAEAERNTVSSADVRGGNAPVIARETLDDRVALADLLLQEAGGVAMARDELLLVLQRDLRHAAAYRLLAQAYERLNEPERAQRVMATLSLLGYAEVSSEIRAGLRPAPRRAVLSDELRQGKLLLPALLSPYMELVQAIAEPLSAIFPAPWPVPSLVPSLLPEGGQSVAASKVADAGFKVALVDVQRLFGIDAEVLVARGVPGMVLALESLNGKPAVILEAGLLDRGDAERRFLLGRAIEPLRGGYALLLRLRQAEQAEVIKLLDNLLRPESERDATAQEFVRALPRKAYKVVERLTGTSTRAPVESFFQALPLCADRAGLLACDDISASVRMMARLQGEELALVDSASAYGAQSGSGVLLGQVAGGAELVRFFLSDAYQDLRGGPKDPSHL